MYPDPDLPKWCTYVLYAYMQIKTESQLPDIFTNCYVYIKMFNGLIYKYFKVDLKKSIDIL